MSQHPFTPPTPSGRGQHEHHTDTQRDNYTPATNGMAASPHTPTTDSRPKLDEAERKIRHSDSENKRRDKIRKGFERLSSNVPGMDGHAASEAIVLHGAVSEIRRQQAIKRELLKQGVECGLLEEGHTESAWENAATQELAGEKARGEGYRVEPISMAYGVTPGIKRERKEQ